MAAAPIIPREGVEGASSSSFWRFAVGVASSSSSSTSERGRFVGVAAADGDRGAGVFALGFRGRLTVVTAAGVAAAAVLECTVAAATSLRSSSLGPIIGFPSLNFRRPPPQSLFCISERVMVFGLLSQDDATTTSRRWRSLLARFLSSECCCQQRKSAVESKIKPTMLPWNNAVPMLHVGDHQRKEDVLDVAQRRLMLLALGDASTRVPAGRGVRDVDNLKTVLRSPVNKGLQRQIFGHDSRVLQTKSCSYVSANIK